MIINLSNHTELDTASQIRCVSVDCVHCLLNPCECTRLMSFKRQQAIDEDVTPSWPGFDNESDNRSTEERTNVFCTTSLQIYILGLWLLMM